MFPIKGKNKDGKFSITCAFCDEEFGDGAGLIDHLISSKHPASQDLRDALAEDHSLYQITANTIDKAARDGDFKATTPEEEKAHNLMMDTLGLAAMDEMQQATKKILKALDAHGIEENRITSSAMYVLSRVAMDLQGCPDGMTEFLDGVVKAMHKANKHRRNKQTDEVMESIFNTEDGEGEDE